MAWLTSYSFKWYRDSWTDTLSKKECPECLFSIYPFSSHSHFQHFLKKDSFQSNTHSLWCYHNNINSFGNFKGRKKNVLSQDRIMEAEEGRKKLVLFFHFLSSTVKCQILQMPGSEYKKLNFGNTNEALLWMKKNATCYE